MALMEDRLSALATTPLAGDDPSGEKITGHGRLDEIVFAKIFNSLSPDPESVDWRSALDESTDLLERSRDLRFARWVAHSLQEVHGLRGLHDGIALMEKLVSTFGSGLHPKANDQKAKVLLAFDEFALPALDRVKSTEGVEAHALLSDVRKLGDDLSALDSSLPRLRKIERWVLEKFPKADASPAATATSGAEPTPATGVAQPTDFDAAAAPPTTTPSSEAPAPTSEAPVTAAAGTQPAARFQELGTRPVSDKEPAGPRLTDWGRLATEYFQKLTSPTAAGEIHWKPVKEASLELLERGKDLRVAIVAANALMRTEGIPGLADGIQLLGLLGATFGERLHPQDAADRIKKLSDFDTESAGWLSEKKSGIGIDALDMVRNLRDQAKNAQKGLESAVSGDITLARIARAASDLATALEREKERLTRPAPAPGLAQKSDAAQRESSMVPAVSFPSGVESQDQAIKGLSDVSKIMNAVARYFREKKPDEPLSQRLELQARWSRVVMTPKNDVIEGPSAQLVEKLQAAVAKGDAPLEELEKTCRERIFWLTGHRLLHNVFETRGEHERAASMHAEATALVRAFPGLAEASFKGGTPFADDETREWLNAGVGSGGGSSLVRDGEDGAAFATVRKDARALAAKSKLPQAVALYQKHWQLARSGRERFLWKFELARFCCERSPEIARSVLGELEDSIATNSLAAWEPDLAVQVFTELLKLCPKEDDPRRRAVFGKLVLIDPTIAASL